MADEQPNDPAAEAELETLLFRNLMEHITDAIYFKDRQSRFLQISRRQAEGFGLDGPQGARGKTDFDFFTELHARAAFEDEREILETGVPIIGKEEQETWPDSPNTWVSTSKLPLVDGDGQIIGTFGISRDITDRKQAEDALRANEIKLREALDLIQADLERARQIQQALMPTELGEQGGLRIGRRYIPIEVVGGDFVSIVPLPGERTAFFIGDLMGHGVFAALHMALLKCLAEGAIRANEARDPAACLVSVNESVIEKMATTFITAQCGAIWRDGGSGLHIVEFAGAGHPPPIRYIAAEGRHVPIPARGNAALGITPEFATSNIRLAMQPDDRLYLYTDGITESCNPANQMLGEEGLLRLLDSGREPDLEAALDALIARLDAFRGTAGADDDILLIGFEFA